MDRGVRACVSATYGFNATDNQCHCKAASTATGRNLEVARNLASKCASQMSLSAVKGSVSCTTPSATHSEPLIAIVSQSWDTLSTTALGPALVREMDLFTTSGS